MPDIKTFQTWEEIFSELERLLSSETLPILFGWANVDDLSLGTVDVTLLTARHIEAFRATSKSCIEENLDSPVSLFRVHNEPYYHKRRRVIRVIALCLTESQARNFDNGLMKQ